MLTKYKETKRKEEKIMIKPKICKMQRFRGFDPVESGAPG